MEAALPAALAHATVSTSRTGFSHPLTQLLCCRGDLGPQNEGEVLMSHHAETEYIILITCDIEL